MRRAWCMYRTEFDLYIDVQELRDVGDDRVVILGHIRLRGAASGIEVESPWGEVQTIRGRKVIRAVDYLDQQEALEAVGMKE